MALRIIVFLKVLFFSEETTRGPSPTLATLHIFFLNQQEIVVLLRVPLTIALASLLQMSGQNKTFHFFYLVFQMFSLFFPSFWSSGESPGFATACNHVVTPMSSFELRLSRGEVFSKENQGGFMQKSGFQQCLTKVFINTEHSTKGRTKIT